MAPKNGILFGIVQIQLRHSVIRVCHRIHIDLLPAHHTTKPMSPGTVIVGIPDPIPLLPGIHGGMGIGMDGLVILDLLGRPRRYADAP